jgi:drug/metabolite transporter (DMT)-like permease
MQNIRFAMGPFEWFLLITLSVLWGGSFFFVGVAIKSLPPLTLVLLRVAQAALVLGAISIVRRQSSKLSAWRDFFIMALINNVIPFCLITWGQTRIGSGLAAILNATTPLFTIIVAHHLTRDEGLSKFKISGIVVGLVGVATMLGLEALKGLSDNVYGQIAILGAAISYAFAGVFGRRFKANGVPPLQAATGQVTASTIVLLPVVLIIDQPWNLALPSVAVIASVVALGVLSTALAYIIYFTLLERAGATNLVLVTFLIPVSALLLGISLLGEQLENQHMVGMLLIGIALLLIDQRLFKSRYGNGNSAPLPPTT